MEPSALVQRQGGPCAVIAPVQAYLLKILMDTPNHCLKDVIIIISRLCSRNDMHIVVVYNIFVLYSYFYS